jgi:hypothetical protein
VIGGFGVSVQSKNIYTCSSCVLQQIKAVFRPVFLPMPCRQKSRGVISTIAPAGMAGA